MKSIRQTYYLILSLFWLATALPMALIVLLGQARGLNLFEIGLLMGIYSLTIVLLEVPTGGLADAIGRKWVAALAYSCLTLASLVFLFAFSFSVFLLAFILNGVGRALASGALDAWFIDALQAADPTVDLQPDLARAGTFGLLALASGTLVGSFIPQLFHSLPADGTAVLTPLAVPVLVATVVHLITLTTTLYLIKEEHPTSAGNWQQCLAETWPTLRMAVEVSRHNPTILCLLGATIAGGLALISLETLWQPFFANLLGGSETNTLFFGVIMGGNFIVGMAGNLLAIPLSRLLNRRYGLVCAIFQGLRGLTLIGLAWQTSAPAAAVLFWLVYMNMGIINSPHSTLLNREIPAGQRSSMLSIESLASYLGCIMGSIGLGFVAEHASISIAWIISGVVLVVSLGLYLQVELLQRENNGQKNLILETH